jgi:hypothetical protein
MGDSATRIYILARAEFSTAFESRLASGGAGRKDDSHCKYHGDAHNVFLSAAVCALSAFFVVAGNILVWRKVANSYLKYIFKDMAL